MQCFPTWRMTGKGKKEKSLWRSKQRQVMSSGSMEIKRKQPQKVACSWREYRGRNKMRIIFLKFPVMSWMTLDYSFNFTLLHSVNDRSAYEAIPQFFPIICHGWKSICGPWPRITVALEANKPTAMDSALSTYHAAFWFQFFFTPGNFVLTFPGSVLDFWNTFKDHFWNKHIVIDLSTNSAITSGKASGRLIRRLKRPKSQNLRIS